MDGWMDGWDGCMGWMHGMDGISWFGVSSTKIKIK